jgi:hypothetical protein
MALPFNKIIKAVARGSNVYEACQSFGGVSPALFLQAVKSNFLLELQLLDAFEKGKINRDQKLAG